MSIWTHELLDRLRQIGDPELDPGGEGGGWPNVPAAGNLDPSETAGHWTPETAAELLQLWRKLPTGALPVDTIDHVASAEPGWEELPLEQRYWITPAEGAAPKRLAIARDLFVEYGGEIGATLLLASLPNAYASEVGSDVLTTTTELRTNTRRRIAETAQFVVEVLFPDPGLVYEDPLGGWDLFVEDQGLPRGSRGYLRVRTTRLTHAVIRSLVSSVTEERDGREVPRWRPEDKARIPAFEVKRGVVINQEDLLGTLATFTVTVFEVMEKLGVPWTDEAEQAYLDLWNQVGELLGIGTKAVTDLVAEAGFDLSDEYVGRLRPKTPAEARELCELIRIRSWPLPAPGKVLGPFAGANGKLLVRALLGELQDAMPRGMERVPQFVMRYLVDPRAHELLGLGGGGVVDSLVLWPAEQRFRRNPGARLGRGAVQASMRLAANDISRRAFIHFIRQRADTTSPFWFPGIPAKFTEIPTKVTTTPTTGPGGPVIGGNDP